MCEWTDKYPIGSKHWLLGEVADVDPGDNRPICFKGVGWSARADVLTAIEPAAVNIANVIEALGAERVMDALQLYLAAQGVARVFTSYNRVAVSGIQAGDLVEVDPENDGDIRSGRVVTTPIDGKLFATVVAVDIDGDPYYKGGAGQVMLYAATQIGVNFDA